MIYEPKLKRIQQALGLTSDGYLGPKTLGAIESRLGIGHSELPVEKHLVLPPNNTQFKIDCFGRPREGFPLVECKVPYKLRIAWDTEETLTRFYCHEKVVQRFQAMFEGWLDHFGADGIRDHGLDLYGGCYAHRSIRGGRSWSDHAYGIAIDIDPDGNGLRTPWRADKVGQSGWASMPAEAIKIAEECSLRNIAAAMGRDAMHFAAVDYGTI
jgi:hypothetical protein